MHAIRKIARYGIIVGGVCFLLFAAGFLAFVINLPETRIEDVRQSDAIVVLTGGSERLAAGVELLKYGYAPELFISGVGEGVKVEELIDLSPYSPEKQLWMKQRIFLGFAARDTHQNAFEVAEWVQRKNYHTIRLVTSSYHMPRSVLELSAQMPGVTIITTPVFPDNVKHGEWWKRRGTFLLFLTEYAKFLAVYVRLLV